MVQAAQKVNASKVSKSLSTSFSAKKTSGSLFFQPKLSIGPVDDIYEREADAMADRVMHMSDPVDRIQPFFRPSISSLQRMCADCEKEEKNMQLKAVDSEVPAPNDQLESYIGRLNSRGQALPNPIRDFYEPRFGYDFSHVKVHTDTVAAKSAQSINALAYTSGNHIIFNQGQFSPGSASGKKLLAHELTHVVQQGATGAFAEVHAQDEDRRVSDL
jgi:hypothetical protein